jgi:hypothetical protein
MRKHGPACAILCAASSLLGGPAGSPVATAAQPPGSAAQAPDDAQPVPLGDQPPGPADMGVTGDPSAPGDAPPAEADTPPVVTTGPISAWGDTLEQSNLVLSRPRPGLDPQGIRIGGFTLLPSLAANFGYEDNIFATPVNPVRSATVAISPSLQLSRQVAGSSLSLLADGLIQRYTNAPSANYEQYEVKGAGAFDLSSALAIQGGAHYNRQAEPRGTSGDVSAGGAPSIFYNPGGSVKVLAGTGPLQLQAGGLFDRYRYASVQVGGVTLPQNFRNRDSYAANGQAGIEVGPGILTFVSGAFDRQRYDDQANGNATIASSRGYSVLGGVDFRITKLVRGRIGAGYLWRHYSGGFSALSGLNYDASVVWNVTTLLALSAKAAKTIEESPSVGSSGIIANTVSISADWELIRKLIISAKMDYAREKYRAISRIDHRAEPSIMVHYLAGRYLSFDAGYTYRHQYGGSILARRYRDNVLTAGITLQK